MFADLLAEQSASEFRVNAYRMASEMIRGYDEPIRNVLNENVINGLVSLRTIGRSIAPLIEQYLSNGHMHFLDRLRGEDLAQRTFTTLPGIGPALAKRIWEQLQIETLAELWAAAKDGRLTKVRGVGRTRVHAITDCLNSRIGSNGNQTVRASHQQPSDVPTQTIDVSEILDVDDEYRRRASADEWPKIRPRRFNPANAAWLPVLHTDRTGRHYTAFYSNTAKAHDLNTIHDWVVIFRDDTDAHDRWTVITS